MLLLCALIVGTSSVWAETYSLTPNKASTGSSATTYITTLTEFTYNKVSWKMNQWNPSTLQVKANQSSAANEFRFYNTSAFPGKITQVVITFSALNVLDASKLMFKGGSSQVTATTGGTAGTWNSTAKTLTWTPSASDNFTYFAFYQDGKAANGTNNLASSNAIVVTYEGKSTPPTINDGGSTSFSGTKPITISAAEGAIIYYTTDNSTPTQSSTLYSGEFTINHSCTIKAIAKENGKSLSDVASKSFTNTALGNPTFTLAAGTYEGTQTVGIECDNADMILYTTDGTDPSYDPLNGELYENPVSVTANTTIKAIGLDGSANASSVTSTTYNIKVVTPTISIPSGVFVSTKTVTIESTTAEASIYYTLNGDEPSTSSTYYSAPFSIDATKTIKAIAVKEGLTNSNTTSKTITKETVYDGLAAFGAAVTSASSDYYVKLTDAQFTYVNNSNGFLSEAEAGAVYYNSNPKPVVKTTYNGYYKLTAILFQSMPEITVITEVSGECSTTTASEVKAPREITLAALQEAPESYYGQQIQLTGVTIPTATTLWADGMEIDDKYNSVPSLEAGQTYTFVGYVWNNATDNEFRRKTTFKKPGAPTISPAEGEFGADFELTLSAATGATIYYTTDGTTPTTNSFAYNSANKPTISAGADVTVKAIAVLAGMTSEMATANYEYRAISQPTFSPVDGTELLYGQTVEISSDVDGTTIHYTLDGTAPSSSSPTYSSPITITSGITIKAIAVKESDESSIAEATYTVKATAPTFSEVAGTYNSAKNITLSYTTDGAKIYYTTDGSTPTSESDEYSSAISVTETTTIKAIAIKEGITNSDVASAQYTLQVVTPTFSVPAGSYDEVQSVEISCETEEASIYYTIDGKTPTSSSTAYTGAISISSVTTLKAIAIKDGWSSSTVASATYNVIVPISLPFIWEGGSSEDLLGTPGVTANGLAADYAAGNAPYLVKFDTSDDYIQIKTNESINFCTIVVKKIGGNGLSSIQASASSNGTDWSNVGQDQPISGDANAVVTLTFNGTFPSNARYVRFTFTKATNVGVGPISVYPISVSGVISPAGWSSFSSPCPLDLNTITGGKAYVASEASGSVVTLTPCFNVVAANTGVMVKGTPKAAFTINVSSADLTLPAATNLLKGQATTSNVTASGTDGKYHYIFGYQTSDPSICGFYNLTAPTPVSAGKAYLETTTALTVPQTGAPAIIRILDEENNATSIERLDGKTDAVKFMENGQIYILREGVVYDALGRIVK